MFALQQATGMLYSYSQSYGFDVCIRIEVMLEALHYRDVIMNTIASQITSLAIFYSTVIQLEMKENIKAPRYWPLCEEISGDRWIPRTNGQ